MPQVKEDTTGKFVFDLSLPITKIMLADLDGGIWHQWLMERLGRQWPHIGKNNFYGHAVSWVNSREYRLVRCGASTALSMVWQAPLAEQPIIRGIFIFCENKDTPIWRREVVRLCRDMQMWGAGMGIEYVRLPDDVDVTTGRFIDLIQPEQNPELWIKTGRGNAETVSTN